MSNDYYLGQKAAFTRLGIILSTQNKYAQQGVLGHIAGPSGSGKTTLLNQLQRQYPDLITQDLDEMDEQAETNLGFTVKKKDYTDDMLASLANERQSLLNKFLQDNAHKPIILGGHHTEAKHVLDLPTDNRWMLNISPEESAQRALKRDPDTRTKSDLPFDIQEAQDVVSELKGLGYTPVSASDIKANLANTLKQAAVTTETQEHQKRVVDRIMDQDGLVVAHGLGSGKTLSSIAAAEALGMPTAVVVPAALQDNYRKEIQKHTDRPIKDIDISSLQLASLNQFPEAELLIVDEAHRIRDPASKGNQKFKKTTAKKRLLLTASPVYNHPADAASLVNLAAGDKVLPETRTDFEAEYVGSNKVDPGFFARVFRGIRKGDRPVLINTDELQTKLKTWIDHHENPPTDDFPERKEKFVHVPLSERQQEVYSTLLKKAPAWVQYKVERGLPPSKSEKSQMNAFLTAQRQVSGSIKPYVKGMTDEEALPHAAKANQAFKNFKRALKKNDNHRAVVYSNFLEGGLAPYETLLEKEDIPYGVYTGKIKKVERDKLVRDYNEGKLKALLVSSAGGEGLDLKGTRQIQILDPHWNNEKIEQVIGRGIRYKSHAHLPEEERNVNVERYIATVRPGWLHKLMDRKPSTQSADQYLRMLSDDKDKLNEQLRKLL